MLGLINETPKKKKLKVHYMDSNITKHKHIVGSDCKITIYRRDVKKEEKELFFFRNKC
jgi:hypothetical protein